MVVCGGTMGPIGVWKGGTVCEESVTGNVRYPLEDLPKQLIGLEEWPP